MTHGWSTRGDPKDPIVNEDVAKAIEMTVDYFTRNM